MFYFKAEKYDFWKIYECIKHYYPIGVSKDIIELYQSYPGIKELHDIIIENIHNESNYFSRWKNFEAELSKNIGKEIRGTTYGQAPSFSTAVLLDTINSDGLVREKQLQCFLSLLGPYYTVVGAEYLTGRIGQQGFRNTAYLVASPENEYTAVFTAVCTEIEKRFEGHKFIPFRVCKWEIEGLEVSYGDLPLNMVFHALFNDHVDLNTKCVVGNEGYKSADWIKEGYVEPEDDGQWTMYPPFNQ